MSRKAWVGVVVVVSVVMLVLVAAVAIPFGLDRWRMSVALRPEFQSVISRKSESEIQGKRVTYSEALSGIVELGDTRLVFPGVTFSGRSSGSIILASDRRASTTSGSTGVGDQRFTKVHENGVTTCTFGGTSFSIEGGVLSIDGHELSVVDDVKEAVFVDSQGKVEMVVPIEG